MLSVVIPAYNEENCIENTIKTLQNHYQGRKDVEFLFSNDGSIDKTEEILEKMAKEDPRIKIHLETQNSGKGNALKMGVLDAQGDIILCTDCDLAYGVLALDEFEKLLEEKKDIDIVTGKRVFEKGEQSGYNFFRRFMSWGFKTFLKIYSRVKCTDTQAGIKGYRKEVAKDVFARCMVKRYAFAVEVLMIAESKQYKVYENPVKILKNNPSSMHFVRDSLQMMRDVRDVKRRIKKEKKN